MSEHFVIVAGYPNTKQKEDLASKLFQRLSKIEKITTCYVTHHTTIPSDILENTNYVIYNKYNPLMNWDICEDYTKNWKFVLETNLIDETLHFPLVNHSFAHLISTCDGIALGINKGYSTFSFMNYDVVDFCIEQLPHHITEIKKNNTDSIFYPFKIKNLGYTAGNTEFFSFNSKFAQKLYPYSKWWKYKAIHEPTLERWMSLFCKKEGLRTLLVENTHSTNGSLGVIAFDQDPDKKFFSPYVKFKDKKNIEYLVYAIPHKVEENYYFIMIPMQDSPKDLENMVLIINDKEMEMGISHQIEKPTKIELKYQKRKVYSFNLTDERHFGYKS